MSTEEATNGIDAVIVADRRHHVRETVARIREIEKVHGTTRGSLQLIAGELVELAKHKNLFCETHFPNPEPGQAAKLYLLSEDENAQFPLYLTCALPGGNVRPHNHGTWAVVAGLDGCEENSLYDRVEGGAEPGPSRIALAKKQRVHDGESIELMPDDIHSVATPGDIPRRHFHMYGVSLERLPKRLAFDMDSGTCDYMEINPKIVRVEHA